MAFTRENLSVMNNNVKSGVVPTWYNYWNEADDTVTGAGFFTDQRLVVGDQVLVLADDYAAWLPYKVTAVASGAATVVASTTPA